jgi:hypothetical protein
MRMVVMVGDEAWRRRRERMKVEEMSVAKRMRETRKIEGWKKGLVRGDW